MDAAKGRKKIMKSKSMLESSSSFFKSFYYDPIRWQLVKHTTIFIAAVYLAKEFSDVDLMAPPPGLPAQ